jgi:hypothetical protein
MLPREWRDLSWPMRYFAQRFSLAPVSGREPTFERLRSSLQGLQTVPPPNHSPHDFLSLSGLLGLNLAFPNFGDHRESYDHNGTDHSVLSSYWVAPQARSILLNGEIDGLIMDTTFRVMRQYYPSRLSHTGSRLGATPTTRHNRRTSPRHCSPGSDPRFRPARKPVIAVRQLSPHKNKTVNHNRFSFNRPAVLWFTFVR